MIFCHIPFPNRLIFQRYFSYLVCLDTAVVKGRFTRGKSGIFCCIQTFQLGTYQLAIFLHYTRTPTKHLRSAALFLMITTSPQIGKIVLGLISLVLGPRNVTGELGEGEAFTIQGTGNTQSVPDATSKQLMTKKVQKESKRLDFLISQSDI